MRVRYERALQIAPEHPGALRGLAQMLPASDREARLAVLERLHGSGAASRWWAAKSAVASLEDPDSGPHDEEALKLWRGRLKEAEEAEARAWEEITGTPFFSQISRHDLSDFELGELRADLVRCLPASRAWLVRKNLREFPWRRAYIVFVELPGLDDEDRWNLVNPTKEQRVPYVTGLLKDTTGPIVATTDYMRAFAEQIRPYMPSGRTYKVLGTDGFGRSDSRAKLREFFEVNRYYITVASLRALADEGKIAMSVVEDAIKKYGINPNKPNPVNH